MPEPKLVEAVARAPEMVRRVAEAITANNGGEWHLWLDEARAAIEAMRRPTLEMVKAAWPNIMHENAEDVWTDMIDAALAAPDEGGRG